METPGPWLHLQEDTQKNSWEVSNSVQKGGTREWATVNAKNWGDSKLDHPIRLLLQGQSVGLVLLEGGASEEASPEQQLPLEAVFPFK